MHDALPANDERSPASQERWKHLLMILEHEMRTPLAAALMQLGVVEHAMREQGSLEQAQRMLSAARRQVSGLSLVMRRIMEIHTRGTIDLQLKPVELGQLARDLVGRLRAANPFFWSRVEIVTAGDVSGSWDASAVEQILENLLSNALKFSRDVPVHLTIRAAKNGAQLEVHDDGPGIATEDQRRIFGLFERGSASQDLPGQGIGLWVVRHLVRAHHGRIRIRSAKGRGTTFVVWLPLEVARPRQSRPVLEKVRRAHG